MGTAEWVLPTRLRQVEQVHAESQIAGDSPTAAAAAATGQLAANWAAEHVSRCISLASLKWAWFMARQSRARPNPGPMQQAASSRQKELPVFPHFGYHLPQRAAEKQHIFPSCGRRVNYNYGHEDRPNSRLTLRLRRQLDLKLGQSSRGRGRACCCNSSCRFHCRCCILLPAQIKAQYVDCIWLPGN